MPDELPEGAFDGPAAFRACVLAALGAAQQAAWRELVLSDDDFADWPLGERAVVDALQAWCAPGRRFTLLARRFDAIERTHARFVQWRRTWDHLIECRAVEAATPPLPSALWTPAWHLQRIDPGRSRGVCGRDAARRLALRQVLDECRERGRTAFGASVLGL